MTYRVVDGDRSLAISVCTNGLLFKFKGCEDGEEHEIALENEGDSARSFITCLFNDSMDLIASQENKKSEKAGTEKTGHG
jgi:hypothetical protein